jgi:serine/threonine protein kinase
MTTNAIAPPDATVLAGKYRLEEVIGVGGMGTVYRARHLVLGSPVAVKLMHRSGEPLLARRGSPRRRVIPTW